MAWIISNRAFPPPLTKAAVAVSASQYARRTASRWVPRNAAISPAIMSIVSQRRQQLEPHEGRGLTSFASSTLEVFVGCADRRRTPPFITGTCFLGVGMHG